MPYKSVQAIEQEKIRSSLNAFLETIPLTLQVLCSREILLMFFFTDNT